MLILGSTVTYAAPETVVVEVRAEVPPILEAIAKCESEGRHFDENGDVLVGQFTPAAFGQDVGKWQINTKYHEARARKLGYDIWSEDGNKQYALLLYKEQGTAPWAASSRCWSS